MLLRRRDRLRARQELRIANPPDPMSSTCGVRPPPDAIAAGTPDRSGVGRDLILYRDGGGRERRIRVEGRT